MQYYIFPIFLYNALYVGFVIFSRHSLYFWAFVFNYPIVSHCTKFVFQKHWGLEVIYIVISMPKGRFCFPKTIEEEEFCIERALPKSTRYKNKWAVSVFKDWQWSRGWWSFKEYELDKVQLLTWPITEIDALMLSYWLSKFVQEVAKCSKDPYPPKTLYQIVGWKEPSHRVQSLGLFRQKGNCIELSSFPH